MKLADLYTTTENGAITPKSTGSVLMDQFKNVASYRNRNFDVVFKDMDDAWSENQELAVKFIFYLRLISRTTVLPNGEKTEKVQKGQGCRDEAFKRLLWLASRDRETFYKNLHILPIVGSWKDLWQIMILADEHCVDINREIVYALMATAMSSPNHVDLIKKYMPRIKTASNIKTSRTEALTKFAREFAKFLGMTSRQYNKFKTDGKAHEFQRLVCAKKFSELNWNKIPGIALGKLVAKEFITRHNLSEPFLEWLTKQDTVKFNGYPYDLLKRLQSNRSTTWSFLGRPQNLSNIPFALRKTVDLQFENLIATAQKDDKISENVLCAIDTSGSMRSQVIEGITVLDVCVSLGIYFSTLNQGHFHKKVVQFDSQSKMLQLDGSFSEMLAQLPPNAMGGTNFLSVIKLLQKYRKENPEVPIEEYPTSILVVSDMQFNPVTYTFEDGVPRYLANRIKVTTNYEEAKEMLYEVFPREYVDCLKFIWWNVNGSHDNVPATMNDGGCYFFGGFDGSILSLLFNREQKDTNQKINPTMEEIMHEALNQEVLSYLKV